MAERKKRSVCAVCPLLLPSGQNSYSGFISSGDRDFRISISLPGSGCLQEARLECDWRLAQLLKGYEELVQKRLEQSRDVQGFLVELSDIVDRVRQSGGDGVRLEPPLPPSFYSQLVNELDTIGWSRVVYINPLFSELKIRAEDNKGREHTLSLHLTPKYPMEAPICSAVTPVLFQPSWTHNTSLQGLLQQFTDWLNQFSLFWDVMDEVDSRAWVLDPAQPTRACTHRRLVIGTNLSLHITVDPLNPLAVPECTFLGPDRDVQLLRLRLNSKVGMWQTGTSLLHNFESLLALNLPAPSAQQSEGMSGQCGICYASSLEGAVVVCENKHCNQLFHHQCLFEWLNGLPTSRHGFNTVFGECPYCSEHISVKVP